MARYTVTLHPEAERQLATIWLGAADRDEVTRASHVIEMLLARSPEVAGESRGANSRICFVPPLAATFELREADRLVQITGYKRMRSSA